jgi:hypothetical protein
MNHQMLLAQRFVMSMVFSRSGQQLCAQSTFTIVGGNGKILNAANIVAMAHKRQGRDDFAHTSCAFCVTHGCHSKDCVAQFNQWHTVLRCIVITFGCNLMIQRMHLGNKGLFHVGVARQCYTTHLQWSTLQCKVHDLHCLQTFGQGISFERMPHLPQVKWQSGNSRFDTKQLCHCGEFIKSANANSFRPMMWLLLVATRHTNNQPNTKPIYNQTGSQIG